MSTKNYGLLLFEDYNLDSPPYILCHNLHHRVAFNPIPIDHSSFCYLKQQCQQNFIKIIYTLQRIYAILVVHPLDQLFNHQHSLVLLKAFQMLF
jgi:hypothetical protein